MLSCRCDDIQRCCENLKRIEGMDKDIQSEMKNIDNIKSALEQSGALYQQCFISDSIAQLIKISLQNYSDVMRIYNKMIDTIMQNKEILQEKIRVLQKEDDEFHEEEKLHMEQAGIMQINQYT